MDEAAENSNETAFARVVAAQSSCFSSHRTTLEFQFGEANDASVEVAWLEAERTIQVERGAVESFLEKIVALVVKKEVSSGSHRTIYYHAAVQWRNLSFLSEDSASGKVEATSNEFTIEELEEFLTEFKNAEAVERLRAVLQKGVHQRAIEVYYETGKFMRRFFADG